MASFYYSTMEGGADTGFRHVEPEQYKTRLLQVVGKGKNLQIREVSDWDIGQLQDHMSHDT